MTFKNSTISWDIVHFNLLGKDNFNRLCLRLLAEEISSKVKPANKQGPDNSLDAFLSVQDNKAYGIINSLCWFQFKYKDFSRSQNTGRNIKNEFKKDFIGELKKVITKSTKPTNYLIITNAELTGFDWINWFEKEIENKYKLLRIMYIRFGITLHISLDERESKKE